ncbi:hypothetical protein NEHOM01_2499 [Nematocida homosporus]|uniref:uncharacterized protein n=1 Tax=Nematocida homosporus TaxID=1912981 RepID=UPI00221F6D4B|nr:uncharacterized protein NEHOM01_2499 [Nematocida homosporus]KAI5188029.1 hypothetical protein NEHOM01_2499 [Nematocida homosporus]
MERVHRICTIQVPPNLTRQSLMEQLRLMAYVKGKPEPIANVRMTIKLTITKELISKSYSIPHNLKPAAKLEIKRLLDEGIIVPATTESYACAAFPIYKRNGSIRLIIDYRPINAHTQPIAYPFPKIEEVIKDIPDSAVFTQIDLRQGYHQIEVEPESRQYTAFFFNNRHYEYTRVPFGLKNATRFFQKTIQGIIGDFDFAKVLLDDILVHSKTEEEHIRHFYQIMILLHNNNVIINFDKSNFFQQSVTYLGHIIDKDGVRASLERVKELEHIQTPRTRKDVQKIIGLFNWFRPFIPGLSELILPLTDLTHKMSAKKNPPIRWTDHHESIRLQVLEIIRKGILLSRPDPSKPFTLLADASNYSIGAGLTQGQKLIGLYSAKLSKSKRNYTTEEKELFAIIKALEHFRNIVFLSDVTVETDHKNLLNHRALDKSRAERWKSALMEYQLDWKYIQGSNNTLADFLSREIWKMRCQKRHRYLVSVCR